MEAQSDPALDVAPSGRAVGIAHWLLAGEDAAGLERIALALSRYGVDCQPFQRGPAQVRHKPVLCDVRNRAQTRLWIEELPWRSAPLLFVGVSGAGARARLIEAGAADAMSARIGPGELAARLKAADRLHAAQQGLVRLAGFDFDTGLRQARWQGLVLPLMPREFDLLLVLARHAGDAISREDLLHAVWRTRFDPGTNSVEVHVCKLRRSLAPLRGRIWIETVRHCGYRLVSNAASEG